MRTDGLRRRGVGVRYLILAAGEVTSKLSVILAFAYLARVLGPRDFGLIELALSTTLLVVLGVELGLGSYGARLVETAPDRAPTLLPRAGLIRLALAVPAYLAMAGIAAMSGAASRGLLAVYGLIVLLAPFNTQWVFQGLRQMQWVAAGSLLRYGAFAVLVILLVRPGTDLRVVALAEVAGAATLAIFNSVILVRALRIQLDWRGAWSGAHAMFRETWFLGASDLAWMAMWLSPAIIVGWLDSGRTEEVAWIAAAVRVVMACHTFVWLYFFNLIPNLSRELHEGLEGWRGLIDRSVALSMWPACFVAVGGTFLAPFVMTTLFGQAYQAAVLPLQIVIWMIPVSWLSGHFRYSLIASGRQSLDFLASCAAAVTTVAVALAAGPVWGAPGAAVAVLSAGVVNTAVAALAVFNTIGAVGLRAVAPALVTCAVSVFAGAAVCSLSGWPIGGAVACALYAAVGAARLDFASVRRAWEGHWRSSGDA